MAATPLVRAQGMRRVALRLAGGAVARLRRRAVVEVSGADALKLLQGLVTNDVRRLAEEGEAGGQAMAAAFLTPKGRVMADALVVKAGSGAEPRFLLDCPAAVRQPLVRHLKVHKLRSKAKVLDRTDDFQVLVGIGGNFEAKAGVGAPAGQSEGSLVAFADPRHEALGTRLIAPAAEPLGNLGVIGAAPEISESTFDDLCMLMGVMDGTPLLSRTPLECNLDLLRYISFSKGCYVGQELTARTQFKGVVRKRALPILLVPEGDAGVLGGKEQLDIDTMAALDGGMQALEIVEDDTLVVSSDAAAAEAGQVLTLSKSGIIRPSSRLAMAMLRLEALWQQEVPIGGWRLSSSASVAAFPLRPVWWPEDGLGPQGKVSSLP